MRKTFNVLLFYSEWSSDGCWLLEHNKSHTLCNCNHLTSFALLMDINSGKVRIKRYLFLLSIHLCYVLINWKFSLSLIYQTFLFMLTRELLIFLYYYNFYYFSLKRFCIFYFHMKEWQSFYEFSKVLI